MSVQSRKHRGMRTQKVVAEYLAARGWPYAEPAGAGRSGADVTGTPDVAVEVKARREFNPGAYLRQAEGAADGRFPFAVLRLDGQGDTDPGAYVALVRFRDLVPLLHAAGYGDCPDDRSDPPVECPVCVAALREPDRPAYRAEAAS